MIQESIFDDIFPVPKELKIMYRFVGIARLLMVVLLIFASVSLTLSIATTIYYSLLASNGTSIRWQYALSTLIAIFLYIVMLMYYIPQTKLELTLSPKLYEKRKFRLFTVVMNILFVGAFMFSYIIHGSRISEISISGVPVYGGLIFFLFIITMDIILLASPRNSRV